MRREICAVKRLFFYFIFFKENILPCSKTVNEAWSCVPAGVLFAYNNLLVWSDEVQRVKARQQDLKSMTQKHATECELAW